MKIGVKVYCDEKFADYFKDKADFLEVMAIQGKDYSFLENYPLPIVIHAMHEGLGVNVADKSLSEKNLASINFAISLADHFNSNKIILHPGTLENVDCSLEQSMSLFKNLDNRIIFENLSSKINVCSKFLEVKQFISETNRDFCLDVNHAIQISEELGVEFIPVIKDFLTLRPAHYHIGGQRTGIRDRGHRSFEDSNIPLKEILSLFPNDVEVTLEVTKDIEKTEKDLEFIRSLIA